jgi:hypothetical protein
VVSSSEIPLNRGVPPKRAWFQTRVSEKIKLPVPLGRVAAFVGAQRNADGCVAWRAHETSKGVHSGDSLALLASGVRSREGESLSTDQQATLPRGTRDRPRGCAGLAYSSTN